MIKVDTIKQLLHDGSAMLQNTATPQFDAELLLAHVLQQPRHFLYAWPDRVLTPTQKTAYMAYIQRCAQGEPVAYIIGARDFWSLNLKVTPDTLIPRVETELLVELALQYQPKDEAIRLLDLGTGSGAIAIALAIERPYWQITAVDQSAAALTVAKANANKYHVKINFLQSNWFLAMADQSFHCIVANPPYVEKTAMTPALQYEPSYALFADEDGLADLKHIIRHAPPYLLPKGMLLLEHGCNQAAAVRDVLQVQGYQHIKTCKDLAGLDRVTLADWNY